MAQVSRTPVIMMTNPQAKIAMTTITRSSVDTAEPRVCLMTSAIGVPDCGQGDRVAGSQRDGDQEHEPQHPRGEHGLKHRAGNDPLGVVGLLGEVGRRLESDDGERAQQEAQHPGPRRRPATETPKPFRRNGSLAEQVGDVHVYRG